MKKALLISCFNWYPNRLKYIREVLIEKGYEVQIVTSSYSHIQKETVAEMYPECTYINVPSYRRNISYKRIRSHLIFGKKVGEMLLLVNPDLIYLLVPPNNLGKYCSQYKKSHLDTKLFVDVIDMWPESMPLGQIKKTSLIRFWAKWRNDCISIADHVFLECSLYRETLNNTIKLSNASVLYLCKDQTQEEIDSVYKYINTHKYNNKEVKLAFVGSMNSIVDIDGICSIITGLINSEYKVELHAIGCGDHEDEFNNRIKETGCQLYSYGPIFDNMKKIKILAPCDYGINMIKEKLIVGLSIKSLDYLSMGLPLINSVKGDTSNIIKTYNLGVNVSPEDRISSIPLVDHLHVYRVFQELFSSKTFKKTFYEAIMEQNGRII